ncbi:hypothetical protein GWI33_009266 [Rhynchophorus ferrugineus]|uniref:Uncharacterized protein n=1 Tax=Rhynchophorus ferrugineus TaxID=354439 RepID=A0A834IBR0_RHYFE|nr:hypothetical protein GWI33_009266 [Rhynchophorus ferrugineus]
MSEKTAGKTSSEDRRENVPRVDPSGIDLHKRVLTRNPVHKLIPELGVVYGFRTSSASRRRLVDEYRPNQSGLRSTRNYPNFVDANALCLR